jgi:hypothetical protein
MQSGYIRVRSVTFLKIITITLIISTSGCSFNLENPKLPDYVSCQGSKCCYKIAGSGDAQICGAGTLNDLQFQLKYIN